MSRYLNFENFSSPVRAPATAFRNLGVATATTIASTTRTRRTARRSRARRHSSSATTGSSASTSRTSVTEFQTAKTDQTSSGVPRWLQISAPISNSGLNHVLLCYCCWLGHRKTTFYYPSYHEFGMTVVYVMLHYYPMVLECYY